MRPHPRPARLALAAAGSVLLALGATAPSQAATWRDAPAPTLGDRATTRIVGGTVLPDTTQAPYTVAVQTIFEGDNVGGCSGTILDPTHVLTAAHCVVEENGTRATPDQVAVAAGTVDVTTPQGRATGAVKGVATIRVHPRYSAGGFFDDAAVLTLSTPLDFSVPTIQPLAMVRSGTNVSPGRSVRVSGFGITGANAGDFGRLRAVNVRSVIGGSACANTAPGAFLCTQGTRKGACSGDSGGTATIGSGTARRLIGVTDIADSNCQGLNFFANVAAPEIRTFIDAAVAEQDLTPAQTPLAPRGGRSIKISGTARVGRTVTCRRGSWSAGTKFRYAFLLDRGTRQRNRGFRTKRTYTVRSADRGWKVFCAVEVRNAGGQGISVASNSRTVR
ncbi:trypsin-like serine protease [Patulibacter sp.]|uniref:S1 family peptidase n=1 Tax=Patulibacter sp. TaxID=1912859 RepID=UPI0027212E6B|nr:serine protease [Patulibacter sp.]MDO9410326.1 serine protease [Patulibacter sp.]